MPTRADTWEEGPCVGLGKDDQTKRVTGGPLLKRNLVAHATCRRAGDGGWPPLQQAGQERSSGQSLLSGCLGRLGCLACLFVDLCLSLDSVPCRKTVGDREGSEGWTGTPDWQRLKPSPWVCPRRRRHPPLPPDPDPLFPTHVLRITQAHTPVPCLLAHHEAGPPAYASPGQSRSRSPRGVL